MYMDRVQILRTCSRTGFDGQNAFVGRTGVLIQIFLHDDVLSTPQVSKGSFIDYMVSARFI